MATNTKMFKTSQIQLALEEAFATQNSVIIQLWFKDDKSDMLNAVFTDSGQATTWLNDLDVKWEGNGGLNWSMLHGRLITG